MRLSVILCCLLAAVSVSAETLEVVFMSGGAHDTLSLYMGQDGDPTREDDQRNYYPSSLMSWVADDGLWLSESRPWTLPYTLSGRYYCDPQYNASVTLYWETDVPVWLTFVPSWAESWTILLTPGGGIQGGFGIPSGTGTWSHDFTVTVAAVPEPSGIITMLMGFSSIGGAAGRTLFRRIRHRASARKRAEAFFIP